MADAVLYLKIYMAGLIALAAFWTPFSILRALGDSTTPLIFLIICSLLNIVLDLIFVVPLQMGVAGAAIATVLSQAIAAARRSPLARSKRNTKNREPSGLPVFVF